MKFKNADDLALYVITKYLWEGAVAEIDQVKMPDYLKTDAACFVTVYYNGKLRGCIGNVRPTGPLYQAVIDNAISAIRDDPRFEPVTVSELDEISVKVSVLSPLSDFLISDNRKMLEFLAREKPGLVISKNNHQAVFLPQVWEELQKPEVFLAELCFKAGLSPDDWKSGMKFKIFREIPQSP